LRQAGMLHATSEVFVNMEVQAVVLLTLAILACIRGSVKFSIAYVATILTLSIIPWLRFFSDLKQTH
jgi:hypothetical protein